MNNRIRLSYIVDQRGVKAALLSKYKLIAIISSQREDLSGDFLTVVEELYRAGVRVFEVTNTTSRAVELVRSLYKVKCQRGDILVGVGTIESVKDLRSYIEYVDFVVSDIIPNKAVFALAKKQGLVMMPGALTPNEIKEAWRRGADFVKVFPVSWIGPRGVRAIKRTHGHIPLVPTGGVKLNQIKEYLSAGAGAFGVGGEIFNDEMLAKARRQKDYRIFSQPASRFIKAVKPRIFSLGEAMAEILIETGNQKSKKISEDLLLKYISRLDYREGLKNQWRSGSLCQDLDKVIEGAGEEIGEIEIKEGETTVVIRAAGDAANVLTVPAKMGGEAVLLSAFGDCRVGHFLRRWYQSRGINLEYCQAVKKAHCGAFFLLSIGKRYSRFGSAVNRVRFSRIPYRVGDILHFTGISQMISPAMRQQCLRHVKAAARAGAKISYNLNDRPALRESKEELQRAFAEVAPLINYLFLGVQETKEVFNLRLSLPRTRQVFITGARAIGYKFFKECSRLETLIVTGGKLGFCLITPPLREGGICHFPSDIVPPKKIVEPVGAGDSLIGGFLYALSRQFPLAKCAEVANVCAGLSLLNRGSGGLAGPLGLMEIKELLQRHYGWSEGKVMRL